MEKTIFLKEVTSKVESLSTLDHFENTFSHIAVALKWISQSLFSASQWLANETEANKDLGLQFNQTGQGELATQATIFSVSKEEEDTFLMFEKLIDQYMEAQEGISNLKIDDICAFLKIQFTKFDAFYTVQEYILFLLRNLFNYPINFEVDYSKAMNLLVGLPVYNLNPKLRQDLMEWCEGRNFPEKELYANSQDSIRKTGYLLSVWCLKMLEIFE